MAYPRVSQQLTTRYLHFSRGAGRREDIPCQHPCGGLRGIRRRRDIEVQSPLECLRRGKTGTCSGEDRGRAGLVLPLCGSPATAFHHFERPCAGGYRRETPSRRSPLTRCLPMPASSASRSMTSWGVSFQIRSAPQRALAWSSPTPGEACTAGSRSLH